MNKLKYITAYIILINVVSFILFFADKEKAKRDKWRIKESTLYLVSFLGGATGSFAAMLLFHHKIRKPLFVIITLTAVAFNIFIFYCLYTYFIVAAHS